MDRWTNERVCISTYECVRVRYTCAVRPKHNTHPPNSTPNPTKTKTFNVVSEHLATETAAALQANKLIFITEGQTLVDTRTGHVIQNIRLKDAKALLEYHRVVLYPRSVTDGCMVGGKAVLTEARPSDNDYQAAILRFTRYSVQALNKGVRRSHLVSPGNGRLLQVCVCVCASVWVS
jgi:hypothetical protein